MRKKTNNIKKLPELFGPNSELEFKLAACLMGDRKGRKERNIKCKRIAL